MIEMHWLWIPLIVTLFFLILALIFDIRIEGIDLFAAITSTLIALCFIIYTIAGVWWLFTHVKVLT